MQNNYVPGGDAKAVAEIATARFVLFEMHFRSGADK